VRDAGNGWLDAPSNGEKVSGTLAIKGWAFKDGVGLARIEVLVDGRRSVMRATGARSTSARPGRTAPIRSIRRWASTHRWIPPRWRRAALAGPAPARRDGSVEEWQEQPFEVR
jgi:hypothetical protein